jgi:hypothetical protein
LGRVATIIFSGLGGTDEGDLWSGDLWSDWNCHLNLAVRI